jgi:hypothetical protein
MKRWMAAAAAVLAGMIGVAAPGTARAAAAPGWIRVFQSPLSGSFFSIAAIGQRNIWAAGDEFTPSGNLVYKPFIRHFNGSAWTPMTIPGAAMTSDRVQATSGGDVWVFGLTKNPENIGASAAYRWDGAHWHRIPLPAFTYLQGSVVLGPSSVWAFGSSETMDGNVFHWNGRTWKSYNVNFLNFIPQYMSASSGSNVWLTGMIWANKKTEVAKAYRWNGSRWLGVATPHPAVTSGPSVTALSPSNVWIGWQTSTKNQAAHWNGHTWTVLTSPDTVDANSFDITPDGRGGYWFGPFADWTGKTWISADSISPDFSRGGFGDVVRIPGTSTFLMAAGVANTDSSAQQPTLYRLTLS